MRQGRKIAPSNGNAEKGQCSMEGSSTMLEEGFQDTAPKRAIFPRKVGMLLEYPLKEKTWLKIKTAGRSLQAR